jgi:hypothetical protein
MGLKTKNYEVKKVGITLPEAYAVLKNLIIETDNRGRAIFAIQQNRESANTYVALDKVEVRFTWDRKTDPAKMAYNAAKTETREVEDGTDEEGNVLFKTEYGPLYGWTDDYV